MFYKLYIYLVEAIQYQRKECGITIKQLCSESHVSTKTYAKFCKKRPIKTDCCFKLVKGIGMSATYEEFMEFWMKLGDWIYRMQCKP